MKRIYPRLPWPRLPWYLEVAVCVAQLAESLVVVASHWPKKHKKPGERKGQRKREQK